MVNKKLQKTGDIYYDLKIAWSDKRMHQFKGFYLDIEMFGVFLKISFIKLEEVYTMVILTQRKGMTSAGLSHFWNRTYKVSQAYSWWNVFDCP